MVVDSCCEDMIRWCSAARMDWQGTSLSWATQNSCRKRQLDVEQLEVQQMKNCKEENKKVSQHIRTVKVSNTDVFKKDPQSCVFLVILLRFYPPVVDSNFLGGQSSYSSLFEDFPYALNGLVPLAAASGQARLEKQCHEAVRRVLQTQSPEGWEDSKLCSFLR